MYVCFVSYHIISSYSRYSTIARGNALDYGMTSIPQSESIYCLDINTIKILPFVLCDFLVCYLSNKNNTATCECRASIICYYVFTNSTGIKMHYSSI